MGRVLILASDGRTVRNVVIAPESGVLPPSLEAQPHLHVAEGCAAQIGDEVDQAGNVTFRPEPPTPEE